MSRILHLVDSKTNQKLIVKSALKFGRSTPNYTNRSGRISRTHFEIEPLSDTDSRSNSGLYSAQLTLSGHFLRITSPHSSSKEYSKGAVIFLKDQDIIDLVSPQYPKEQVSFTLIDPQREQSDYSQTLNPRKRKRMDTLDSHSDNDSLITTPMTKRRKISTPKLNGESMAFDYGDLRNNNVHSNIQQLLQNDSPLSAVRTGSGSRNNSGQPIESLSLSGLMVSAESEHNESCISSSASKRDCDPSPLSTTRNSKYNLLNSFPMDDDDGNNGNESDVIYDEEKDIIEENVNDGDEDSQDLESLLNENDRNHNTSNTAKMDKNQRVKQEQSQQELVERRLFEEGRLSLALPVIDCNRYKFDEERAMTVIARVLKQFMTIHRYVVL